MIYTKSGYHLNSTFISLFLLSLMMFIPGCKKYNEEELILESELCTADSISFSRHIHPTISVSCLPCHGSVQQQGNIVLETYNDISTLALDGTLLGVIRHEPGYAPMPQSAPKLNPCKIRAFEIWITQGATNN